MGCGPRERPVNQKESWVQSLKLTLGLHMHAHICMHTWWHITRRRMCKRKSLPHRVTGKKKSLQSATHTNVRPSFGSRQLSLPVTRIPFPSQHFVVSFGTQLHSKSPGKHFQLPILVHTFSPTSIQASCGLPKPASLTSWFPLPSRLHPAWLEENGLGALWHTWQLLSATWLSNSP